MRRDARILLVALGIRAIQSMLRPSRQSCINCSNPLALSPWKRRHFSRFPSAMMAQIIEEFARRNTLSVPNVIELHTAPDLQRVPHRVFSGVSLLGPVGCPLTRTETR